MRKTLPGLVVGILLLGAIACSKNGPPPQETSVQGDRVVHLAATPPQNFLHQTFPVQAYKAFEISVPSHAVRPRVHGTFQSFVKNDNDSLVSNESANVDLMLLSEEEFAEFHQSKQGTATYTLDPSYDQMVDWALSPTLDQPGKYYLVFRNSPGGRKSKFVKADFTASFD